MVGQTGETNQINQGRLLFSDMKTVAIQNTAVQEGRTLLRGG